MYRLRVLHREEFVTSFQQRFSTSQEVHISLHGKLTSTTIRLITSTISFVFSVLNIITISHGIVSRRPRDSFTLIYRMTELCGSLANNRACQLSGPPLIPWQIHFICTTTFHCPGWSIRLPSRSYKYLASLPEH